MILSEPYGGISNRLKCIISTMSEYENINLNWSIPPSPEHGGVRCHFNDLFKNTFDNGPTSKRISACEFIHKDMNTNNFGDKLKLDSITKENYIKVINSLKPVDYVIKKVVEEKYNLPKDVTTVSVRTFKSFKRENDSWGRYFKISDLFEYMDNISEPILLTCDDTETTKQIKERYGDVIHMTEKRTRFGDFTSIEGMQDILIDLYLGGMSKKIYGTHMSSFSEMQWWFGNCTSEYNNMLLHKK